MKETVGEIGADLPRQLREVLEGRDLHAVFQPIFGFRSRAFLGYEALVRGPEGSPLGMPEELFRAAEAEGRFLELNVACLREVLREFARRGLPGDLFLNVSPRLLVQRGFDQERAGRFLAAIGIAPARVVIELTEDYPASDFRLVRESLALYRSMGFRIAIDDLGEGFASLRLWSELRPEFVKADKHFVTGIATDPVKVQFLRSIQHIAESCGSLVIAEGVENAQDFRVVKDVGIACAQGYFIGVPEPAPALRPSEALASADADPRLPVVPMPRRRAGTQPRAREFLRSVDAVVPREPLGTLLERFAASPRLAAIPVIGSTGIVGVVSRSRLGTDGAPAPDADPARPCAEFADAAPIRVEAELELDALTAILVESDARRLADGFVIVEGSRYLGMGASQDVMRALHSAQALAARYTNPLTLLPGQVPINEHLERLLARRVPFTAWYAEVDRMRGLNDAEGFAKGDALIHDATRLLESVCEPGVDFAGHIAGTRFVLLLQSADWRARAERALAGFAPLLAAHVEPGALARGYFTAVLRDGRETLWPLPKLVLGILPVLPGVFESRHEVLATAKQASRKAQASAGAAMHVDDYHGNAYPKSLLFDER